MSIVVQGCDVDLARHQISRALCAASLGWGVGRVLATSTSSDCELTPPSGRSAYQLGLEEAVIRIAARIGAVVGVADEQRCNDLAEQHSFTDSEAQAFLDYAYERALSIIERAEAAGFVDRFVQMLDERDGVLDVPLEPVRDLRPLIELRAAPISVSMPAPVVHVHVPEQVAQAPVVNIENTIEQPDKLVTFSRDFAGNITEAIVETAEPQEAA